MSSGRCVSAVPSLSQIPAFFGGTNRTWYGVWHFGHDRRPARRSTIDSSGTSNATTRSSGSRREARIRSRASAWPIVRGKPSRMNPFAQSGFDSRSSMMSTTVASETSRPSRITCSTVSPSGVRLRTASRRRSPVEMWTQPRFSAIRLACVPLPEPGGPSNTSLMDDPQPRILLEDLRFAIGDLPDQSRIPNRKSAPPAPDASAAADEALVVVHEEVGFDLLRDVEADADDDQDAGAAEEGDEVLPEA